VDSIQIIVNKFVTDLDMLITEGARERAIASLGGADVKKASLSKTFPSLHMSKKSRRKGPIQLCPVPGCKERAAPVFGMVCSKHKGLAKKVIAKYRAARKAKAKK
jgi:hypothetical protein